MQTTSYVQFLAIGLVAGVFSGMFGIGGGLIIVPALTLWLGYEDKTALGTSLAALIPPVGLLGAKVYYSDSKMDLKAALLIAAGLFLAAWVGAKITIAMPKDMLRRAYGIFLLLVGARYLFFAR